VDNLYAWSETAAAALGVPAWAGSKETVGVVLDVAKETAHGVARPAAPVGSFLAGMAVGLAGARGPEELARVWQALRATIPERGAEPD
jgi:hypothetical protein